jgi:hypothetical protein
MNMMKKSLKCFLKPSLCLFLGIIVAVLALYCFRRFTSVDPVQSLLDVTGAEQFEEDYDSEEEEPEMYENDEEDYEDKDAAEQDPAEKKSGAARVLNALGVGI